jgi:hypothetical protein
MSIAVPKEIREKIQEKIWDKADELDWSRLSDLDRAIWYENWSKDNDIGGVLAHFMDPRKVRVYIKDSLLKPYLRTQLGSSADKVLLSTGLSENGAVVRAEFDKPHGRLMSDGKIICWGNSRDWKAVVISVFERARRIEAAEPYAAVLIESGRSMNSDLKEVVIDVGRRLGLEQVVWID